VWNTIHGHPFRFTNMRQHLPIEAFGTDTRLSFHVEPILLPLSLVHLVYPGPQSLLVVQTLVLASGALAARRLARRHLPGSHLAELVFPLAYLLTPALQAANLYEFHPVTLTAALLLWAIDLADDRRILPFVAVAVLAIACKEEIGLDVALLALWSLRRGMPHRIALPLAAAAVAWSLIGVFVVVPAAQRAEHSTVTSSPYLTRYLDRSLTVPGKYQHVIVADVARSWLDHPDRLASLLLGPPKRGFLQRLLAPAGYASLFSPLTLATGLPSALLILLSTDQHMYGGLGHYSAELVGIVIGSAIFGVEGLVSFVRRRSAKRVPMTTLACLVILFVCLANARLNGLMPLADPFEWPDISAHVRLGEQMLRLIPPTASVSAQDTLDPHLSDRPAIYLFPDTSSADYVALDVAASPIPLDPDSLHRRIEDLLRSRRYDVLFADDGYLLLRRRRTPLVTPPHLPAAFYRFASPARADISHPLRAMAGPDLVLLGYNIIRRETVNLRIPDVVFTTYWKATTSLPSPFAMTTYLTDVHGRLIDHFESQAALSWVPPTTWRPGQVVAIASTGMGVGSTQPGAVRACLDLHESPSKGAAPRRLHLRILSASASSGPVRLLDNGTVLCVGRVPVIF
jgi:uncharacterized membrane protein